MLSNRSRTSRCVFTALLLPFVLLAGCSVENLVGPKSESVPASNGKAATEPVAFTARWESTVEIVPPFPPPILNLVIRATGNGTMIGQSTYEGPSQVDVTQIPNVQTTSGTVTTARGDQIYVSFVGVATPADANGDVQFEGTFEFTGGTGRFSNVSGGGRYSGTANVITQRGLYEWVGHISTPSRPGVPTEVR